MMQRKKKSYMDSALAAAAAEETHWYYGAGVEELPEYAKLGMADHLAALIELYSVADAEVNCLEALGYSVSPEQRGLLLPLISSELTKQRHIRELACGALERTYRLGTNSYRARMEADPALLGVVRQAQENKKAQELRAPEPSDPYQPAS